MRGSPLIPSMGWQDFEYVVKLITAKKVKKSWLPLEGKLSPQATDEVENHTILPAI